MREISLKDEYDFIINNYEDMTKESFLDLMQSLILRGLGEQSSNENAHMVYNLIMHLCIEYAKRRD